MYDLLCQAIEKGSPVKRNSTSQVPCESTVISEGHGLTPIHVTEPTVGSAELGSGETGSAPVRNKGRKYEE